MVEMTRSKSLRVIWECLTSIQKVLGSNRSWVLIFFRTPSAAQRDVEKQFVICLS